MSKQHGGTTLLKAPTKRAVVMIVPEWPDRDLCAIAAEHGITVVIDPELFKAVLTDEVVR